MDSEVDSAAIICGCEGHAHAIKKVWSGDGRTLDRLLRSQFALCIQCHIHRHLHYNTIYAITVTSHQRQLVSLVAARVAVMSNLWRIFVYGTLKRGQYNHYVMRGATGTARLIAEAKLVRSHPIVVGKDGVPYMLPIEASKEVRVIVVFFSALLFFYSRYR